MQRFICGVVVALSLLVGLDNLLPRTPTDVKRVGKLVNPESDLSRLSPPVDLRRNGELLIAGRALRCGRVRNVLDPGLSNPRQHQVSLFSIRIGQSAADAVRPSCSTMSGTPPCRARIGADCWAVKQGVSQGWFDHQLSSRCAAPAMPQLHASSARRASLRQ